jgi:hypothetical protein
VADAAFGPLLDPRAFPQINPSWPHFAQRGSVNFSLVQTTWAGRSDPEHSSSPQFSSILLSFSGLWTKFLLGNSENGHNKQYFVKRLRVTRLPLIKESGNALFFPSLLLFFFPAFFPFVLTSDPFHFPRAPSSLSPKESTDGAEKKATPATE